VLVLYIFGDVYGQPLCPQCFRSTRPWSPSKPRRVASEPTAVVCHGGQLGILTVPTASYPMEVNLLVILFTALQFVEQL
jgi:hypothetical protein